MKFLLLLLLLLHIGLIRASHVSDEMFIYRIHPNQHFTNESSDTGPLIAEEEFHVRSSSLGKLIYYINNRSIISPESSYSLPPLSCLGVTKDCAWMSHNPWARTNVSTSEDIFMSFPIDPSVNPLADCEWKRISSPDGSCSCPYGFSVNINNNKCDPNISCTYKMTEPQSFSSPGFPGLYNHSLRCYWLILAPENTNIHLRFLELYTEDNYDFVKVYESPELNLISSYTGSRSGSLVISHHQMLLVALLTDLSGEAKGFYAEWETVPRKQAVPQREPLSIPALKLQSSEGYLSTQIIVPQSLCITAVYKSANSFDMFLGSIDDNNSKLQPSHHTQVNGWHRKRFMKSYALEDYNIPQNLSVKIKGIGSVVMSIMACEMTEDEDVYKLGTLSYIPQDNRTLINGSKSKCFNNGIFINSLNECVCSAGFTGPFCEIGCGPNRYGNDCGGICSGFEKGCSGMIFCSKYLPCVCGPGFKGTQCNAKCDNSYYGNNCTNRCGKCYMSSCDIYTGECPYGCMSGFYPPLCQETYVRIEYSPVIESRSWNQLQISTDFQNLKGQGDPYFFQVQFQMLDSSEWMETTPQQVPEKIGVTNITGLKAGTKYRIKVIIISENGQTYQGNMIPLTEFETKCTVPDSKAYHLRSTNITSNSFQITWKYILNPEWCPLSGFKIYFQYGWRVYPIFVSELENSRIFSNLMPGYIYQVQVQAITKMGPSPPSSKIIVTTAGKAPGKVRELKATFLNVRKLHISWEAPWSKAGNITSYKIKHQCIKFLACSIECESSRGEQEVSDLSVNIDHLIPHAQYLVQVAAISATMGPYSQLFVATNQTVPDSSPEPSAQPIVARSNTSVTLQWEPSNCTKLNGFLQGYYYELYFSNINQTKKLIQHGTLQNTTATFFNLQPHSSYEVKVFTRNVVGRSINNYLSIPFVTFATAPDAVQNLTVYKKGRRMVGIRWTPPTKTYGDLKSFVISYKHKNREVKETIDPVSCPAWPTMFCHTIRNLAPDTSYNISVSARNMEIDDDGSATNVIAMTREDAPGVASSLQVTRATNSSLHIEWELPYMINGVLRSFLVNVEHIDSINTTDCCDYFPVQELPFREESQKYSLEVSGLRSASTYTISVSAKTVTMGPAVYTTYNTLPPLPTNMHPPEVINNKGFYIVKLRPTEIHPGLNGTHLLLVFLNDDFPEPKFFDEEVRVKLTEVVNHTFYVVAELSLNDLQEEKTVKIGTGSPAINGNLVVLNDPELPPGIYQVGHAVVLEYSGAKSVGLVSSEPFIVDSVLVLPAE